MTVVDFIDVGHGACAVFRSAGETFVIDAGNRVGLLEYLAEQKINSVEKIVITHADEDHIGGLIGLLASQIISVKEVVLNGDGSKNTAVWKDLIDELTAQDKVAKINLVVKVSEGDQFVSKDGRLVFTAVGPTKAVVLTGANGTLRGVGKVTSNSLSAVYSVSCDNKTVCLITGDVDDVGLSSILASKAKLDADVLLFPHHGGRPGGRNLNSFVDRLIDAVKPTRVVFSFGRNKFSNPSPAVVARLRLRSAAKVYCTQLSKHCNKVVSGVSSQLLPNVFARGISTGSCCAGTIRVDLDAAGYPVPTKNAHDSFIGDHVKTPLCN